MAKEGKSAVVPRLRFPEFRESTEWKAERIDMLYSFMRNNALSRDKLNYESGSAKNIHYGDIHTKFSALFDITKERVPYINGTEVIPDADSDDFCVEGDIIFADASEDTNDVGKCIEIVRLGGQLLLAGQHTILARRKNDALVIGFGAHLFQSGRIRSQIQKEAQGTKVYAISPTRLARTEIFYPRDEKEQQKIADCLTSLDEVIAAQGRKVEALRIYKRGLMQQLFPREGETLPRLRFLEFRDSAEWEEQTLRSICNRIMDGTHFSPKTKEGPRPYLTSKNIRNGHIDLSTISYISEEEHREIYARCPVKKDDVLLTKDGANTGNCAINTLDYEFSLLSSVAVLRGDTTRVKQSFLYQTIAAERTQSIIINSMSGQAITRITLEKLGNYLVPLPGMAEQQRIADSLSSLDARIAAESAKLATLKTHKQGLMQQLFPSQEEA